MTGRDEPKLLSLAGIASTTQIRASFVAWAEHALPEDQKPANHHCHLIRKLEALEAGEFDRLMVLMPPGAAKSTYTSILFPPWWLARNPQTSIIAAYNTDRLARRFGSRARQLVREHQEVLGYDVLSDHRAATFWRTSEGGEYFAAGVGTAIIGRRADLVLIDDPIRSFKEADNEAARDNLWEWYRTDLMTRLCPSGRVVLVMTRWHEDDLSGRLLAQEAAEWELLKLPALATKNDPLNRSPGDALWPEREPKEVLLRKKTTVGNRVWFAHYQQDPRPIEGSAFDVKRIETVDPFDGPLPEGMVVRGWDLASTPESAGGNPDWTAGVKVLRHAASGRFYVLDVVRFRGSPLRVEETLVKTAHSDGVQTVIGLAQDPGSAGKAYVNTLTARLAGFNVKSSTESGPKLHRANLIAVQVEAGNLAIVRGHWNASFVEELRSFPHGAKDDQVDALSRAFALLTQTEKPRPRLLEPIRFDLGR